MILLAILQINRQLINNFITFLSTKIGRGTFDTECTNNYSFSIRDKILNNIPIPIFTNYYMSVFTFWVPICAKSVPSKLGPNIFRPTILPFALHPHNSFWKALHPHNSFQKLFTSTKFLLVCQNAKTWAKFRSSLFTLTILFSLQTLKLKLGLSPPPK